MATLLCSNDDLCQELDTTRVVKLAADAYTSNALLTDPDVVARLLRYRTEESNRIRNLLTAAVDVDSVVAGTQLADDLRRWATVLTLERLYRRQGHFTEQTNPYSTDKKACIEEIKATRDGRAKIGDALPPAGASASTSDSDTTYLPAASGGSGVQTDPLERM